MFTGCLPANRSAGKHATHTATEASLYKTYYYCDSKIRNVC